MSLFPYRYNHFFRPLGVWISSARQPFRGKGSKNIPTSLVMQEMWCLKTSAFCRIVNHWRGHNAVNGNSEEEPLAQARRSHWFGADRKGEFRTPSLLLVWVPRLVSFPVCVYIYKKRRTTGRENACSKIRKNNTILQDIQLAFLFQLSKAA